MEKRQFARILYQASAMIVQAKHRLPANIRDLSLHGALLSLDTRPKLDLNQWIEIHFPLPDSEIMVEMTAEIICYKNALLHTRIHHLDLESLSHLKRLIELNMGNDALLHRELAHLCALGEAGVGSA